MAKGRKTGGRQKGTPNKMGPALKQSILDAAEEAGQSLNKGGTVGYLRWAAIEYPAAFLGLMGKVLPMTIAGEGENGGLVIEVIQRNAPKTSE
jgi:hypothetical protein